MKTISSDQLKLNVSDVYRSMGTGISSTNIHLSLHKQIKQYRPQALKLLSCNYLCKITPIDKHTETHMIINNSFSLRCNTEYFKGATKVALILLTLGSAIEQEIKKLIVNNYLLDGFILDAYANTALDEFFGIIRSQLEKEQYLLGNRLGYSLSPGCILDIEAQGTIFSFLEADAQEMGVFLRDSYVMFPGKSCSYYIPIGKNLTKSTQTRYACSICPSHNSCRFSPVEKAK